MPRGLSRLFVAVSVIVLAAVLGAAPVAAATPNDTYFGRQWALSRIGAPTAWDTGTGAGVVVAVIDTGVDLGHPDLAAKLVPGRNLVKPGSAPQDDHSHGTHVAGIAAAITGNGTGIAGTAPDAAIMPVKVLASDGSGSSANVSEGIHWAVDQGARVINLSLGGFAQGLTGASFTGACAYAWSRGAICVVAAGNDFVTGSGLGDDNLLVVTATDPNDRKPAYASGVGEAKWGLAAPGGGDSLFGDSNQRIWSTVLNGSYGYKAGTSMAAPHVSGAAAVLFGLGLSNQQVADRLLGTARDLGDRATFGSGLLDLAAAVNGLSRPAPAPTSSTTTTTSTTAATTTTSTTTAPGGTTTTTTTAPGGTTTTTAPGGTTTTTAPAADGPAVYRLAGADRMETAIAASRDQYGDGTADAVVLARADTFPDALAGTPLAVRFNGPLLLTAQPALDARTRDEILRVLPPGRTVHLLGGHAALGQAVEDALRQLGYRTTRYAGSDRFDTAAQVARLGLGDPGTLLLANGLDFPDALIAGAAAPRVQGAVLLTAGGSLPPATASHLGARPTARRYAVGAPAAQADRSATPLVGADAPATSRRVAEALFPDATTVALASATGFADALGGGAHIARRAGPLLLTDPRALSPVLDEYLRANRDEIRRAFLGGGPAALSEAVADGVRAALS